MSWHPEGRYVEVAGRRAHCVDVGRGPPVLLLHGFLHSSYTWRASVAALAQRYRVIVPDLVGFGWSARGPADYTLEGFGRWVDGVLAALGVERLHAAAGNSLGGAVALDLALRAPERVGRLLLVNALAGRRLLVPDLPLRILGHRAFGPLFRVTAGNMGFVRRALTLAAYRACPVDEEVIEGFRPLALPGSHAAAVATARALGAASTSLAARLAHLRAPTLLVWGARDRVLPLRYGHRIAADLPGARLEVFEGCGHCPHEEHPERFNALAAAFLAEGQGADQGALQGAEPVRAQAVGANTDS